MIRVGGVGLLALGTLAVVACASVRVQTDYDDEVDFAGLHTFAWIGAPSGPQQGAPPPDPLLDRRIRDAVTEQLALRGYRRVESNPDFQVAYHLVVERRIDVDTIYRSYGRVGWRGAGWHETVVREYDQGTFLLDFLDPATGELMWRGTTEGRIRERRTPEERTERVNEVVGAVVAEFPPSR
jgi:hypothetical protein